MWIKQTCRNVCVCLYISKYTQSFLQVYHKIKTERSIFKEEFCVELGIPKNQVERRLDELLNWLRNFYDFEFKKGRPHCIVIKEIIGEY